MHSRFLQLLIGHLDVSIRNVNPQSFSLLSGALSGEHGLTISYYNLLRMRRGGDYLEPFNLMQNAQIKDYIFKNLTFGNGLSGYCWTLNYLERNKFIINSEPILSGLDLLLEKELSVQLGKSNFDLIHGANGLMLYFISRRNYLNIDKLTGEYLLRLRQSATTENGTSRWLSMGKNGEGILEPTNNLGIPHGATGILALLLKLKQKVATYSKEINLLIDVVIESILAEELPQTEYCRFPSINFPARKTFERSSLGWCYGDLAIGYVLLKAARSRHDEYLEKYALNLLADTSTRIDCLNRNNLTLCHGLMSISYLFYKVFSLTENLIFKEASVKWLAEAEAVFCKDENRISSESFNNHSLLYSISGIFLALGSMDGYISNDWDESMLL